jgi:hypothetical protein
MALPTYVVELQFGSSGYVDVTSYVNSITTSRGITRVLDDFPAGNLSVSFTNNDRTFDPLNTSSILWYNSNSNQISNYNFETNTSGWTSGENASISRSTAKAYSGVASLKVTSNTGNADYWANNTVYSAVTAGQSYSASAYVQSETYSTKVHIRIDWYNSSNTLISSSESNDFYVNSSSWTKVIVSDIAPTAAVNAIVTFRNFSVTSSSESMFWDNVYFQSNASPNAYSIVQPAGRIRISANGVRIFTGFVQDWDLTYDQAGLDGQATVTALDEIYRVSTATFTAGTEPVVQDTGSRIKDVLNKNGFGAAEYSGVTYGQTVVGADVHNTGDNVLAYIQNVARSEPADLFSNASAVMVMKDRSFANLSWTNSVRNNLMVWPRLATSTIPTWDGGDSQGPYGTDGWTLGGRGSAVSSLYGGTPNFAQVNTYFNRYEMWFYELNPPKYNPNSVTGSYPYSFSCYLKGSALKTEQGGVYGYVDLLDVNGSVLQHNTFAATTAITSTTWKQFTFSNNYTGSSTAAGISVRFYTGSTGTPYYFYGDGWQLERATALPNYFDGTYNPYTSTASTVYSVGWSGTAYASYSGLVTSVSSAISAPNIYTFADLNSQGTAYGNGTGIPFTDLAIVYGSEQMYNSIQVVGVNATANASDTALIARYGTHAWAQTDNLTTSTTKPATLAANYLSAWSLPEYRAESITVAMEALTSAQQNNVLAIELRDVVRVCFQPSATGAVVDKYYEVLGVDANADAERHHITFRLSSLERLGLSF